MFFEWTPDNYNARFVQHEFKNRHLFKFERIVGNENPILHDEGALARDVYVCMHACVTCHIYRYTNIRGTYVFGAYVVPIRECTRGYKVLRLLYGGRGM